MNKKLLLCYLMFVVCFICRADRIYIVNATGFNTASPDLITAMESLGHTVVVNITTDSVPTGFTSTCVDSVNGYDWLCFFGDADFSYLVPQIQAFINSGGKVFYQYEVGCCVESATGAAAVAAGLTGLNITPNANPTMATYVTGPGWEADNVNCCATIYGNAYRGMDSVPLNRQLLASENLNGSYPAISLCPNFGFYFATTDFPGGTGKGGILGLGDYNIWYAGQGVGSGYPIDMNAVNFVFPNSSSTCYMFPPGCLQHFSGGAVSVNIGNDTSICPGQSLVFSVGASGYSYLWSTGSTAQSVTIDSAQTVWVQVSKGSCINSDTVQVSVGSPPAPFSLGPDTAYCGSFSRVLVAGLPGAVWSNGDTAQQITITTGGTYSAVVSNGCGTVSDTVVITANPLPQVAASTLLDTICSNDSSQICATSGFTSYLWNNGSTADCFYTNLAGNYYVTATNSYNCSATSNRVLIDVLPVPSISITVSGDTLTCGGGTFVQWYYNGDSIPGANSNTLVATKAGQYAIFIVDSNGCTVLSQPYLYSPNGINTLTDVGVNVYPNPLLSGYWTIAANNAIIGSVARIYDADGKLVYEAKIISPKSEIELNASRGVYTLIITSTTGYMVSKLVRL